MCCIAGSEPRALRACGSRMLYEGLRRSPQPSEVRPNGLYACCKKGRAYFLAFDFEVLGLELALVFDGVFFGDDGIHGLLS